MFVSRKKYDVLEYNLKNRLDALNITHREIDSLKKELSIMTEECMKSLKARDKTIGKMKLEKEELKIDIEESEIDIEELETKVEKQSLTIEKLNDGIHSLAKTMEWQTDFREQLEEKFQETLDEIISEKDKLEIEVGKMNKVIDILEKENDVLEKFINKNLKK